MLRPLRCRRKLLRLMAVPQQLMWHPRMIPKILMTPIRPPSRRIWIAPDSTSSLSNLATPSHWKKLTTWRQRHFSAKNSVRPLLPYWLSAGVYVLSREFFERLPDVGDHEDVLFPELASEGRLFAFRSTEYWKAIDTVKDLNEASDQLAALAVRPAAGG